MDILEILTSPYFLACLFFIVAFAYSSVGLAGGSSYSALLAIFGFSALAIPMITLTLNLFVSTVGSFNFIRYKHARFKLITPFLFTSIPMAYLGGSIKLSKEIFYWILLFTLIFIALRIYLWGNVSIRLNLNKVNRLFISLTGGALLGLLAGVVGIGGGVYLIPLIIILGMGSEKEAAACGVIFIWLNSLSGIIARSQYNAIDLREYIPLIVAVIIGGTAGSFLGSTKLQPKTMQKILGVIVLVAVVFLVKKLFIL
jgi:uncharacterized membrane protein YfcA